MVNRMRHNRSQRGSTRSHHALSAPALTKCPECGAAVLRHRACANCGTYRGKNVLAKAKKEEKKPAEAKAQKKGGKKK